MKMHRYIAAVLVALISVPSWAAGDAPVPDDLVLVAPSPDVPEECARFFSESGWGRATWDSGRAGRLYVEKIEPDCTAQVIYSFGSYSETKPGGYARIKGAKITGDLLTFLLEINYLGKDIRADVKYRYGTAYDRIRVAPPGATSIS